MPVVLLLLGCAVLFLLCYRRLGLLHPVTVTLALWFGLAAITALRPLSLVPPGPKAVMVVMAGLVALSLAPLAVNPPTTDPATPRGPGRIEVNPQRLVAAAIVLLGVTTWGALSYREAVEAAIGMPFSEASTQAVRWAELYGGAALGSQTSAALGSAPVLGALAIIGGRYHRPWWYLLLPVAAALIGQSPSRTATLSFAVTSIFFFLLLPSSGPRLPLGRLVGRKRTRAVLLLVSGACLGLAYFVFVGHQLGKAGAPVALAAAGWLPALFVQPLLYELGGLSALSVALDSPAGESGPYGAFGRSVYAVLKLGDVLGFDVEYPVRFASYVNIPVPFNTYTAFGDTHFDLGLGGVLGVFFLTGVVICFFSRWPRPGHPVSVWVLSVMTSILLATPQHMRVLDGDVLLQAVVGGLVLAFVLQPGKLAVGSVVEARTAPGRRRTGEQLPVPGRAPVREE